MLHGHGVAFEKVKNMLTKTPVLAFYNSQKPVVISANVSSYDTGTTLCPLIDGKVKTIAFTSRTLSEADRKYAQIEKDCLACVWACKKCVRCIVGM